MDEVTDTAARLAALEDLVVELVTGQVHRTLRQRMWDEAKRLQQSASGPDLARRTQLLALLERAGAKPH